MAPRPTNEAATSMADLTTLFDEVGTYTVPPVPIPAGPSNFDHHRPLKEMLLASLDCPLGTTRLEEYSLIGQTIQKLLTLGILDPRVVTVLEGAPSIFQCLKIAYDEVH